MQTMNGYTIIATKPAARGIGEIILGVKQTVDYFGKSFEYVTAWRASPDSRKWVNGHYFGFYTSYDNDSTLTDAVKDFGSRS